MLLLEDNVHVYALNYIEETAFLESTIKSIYMIYIISAPEDARNKFIVMPFCC